MAVQQTKGDHHLVKTKCKSTNKKELKQQSYQETEDLQKIYGNRIKHALLDTTHMQENIAQAENAMKLTSRFKMKRRKPFLQNRKEDDMQGK